MKRFYVVPVLVLAIVLSACGQGAAGGGSANAPATVAPTYKEPTVTVVPTDKPRAAVKEFKDEFDLINTDWSAPVTVTTQALPQQVYSKVTLDGSQMIFNLADKETFMYRFYKNPTPQNVIHETSFVAGGNIQNGIALICRAKTDYSSFYEFRVTSNSLYAITHYDKSLKDDQDKNPYDELKSGGIPLGKIHPNKANVMRAICDGTTLTLEINGFKLASYQDSSLPDAGLAGVGAMSHDVVPVNIRFDYLSFKAP